MQRRSIWCLVFGHDWRLQWDMGAADMCAGRSCRRCGEQVAAIQWPRHPPMPAGESWNDVKAAPDTIGAMVDCARLSVSPGDTVVITSRDRLTREQCRQLSASAGSRLPDGVKVLILDAGMTLSVVGKSAPD